MLNNKKAMWDRERGRPGRFSCGPQLLSNLFLLSLSWLPALQSTSHSTSLPFLATSFKHKGSFQCTPPDRKFLPTQFHPAVSPRPVWRNSLAGRWSAARSHRFWVYVLWSEGHWFLGNGAKKNLRYYNGVAFKEPEWTNGEYICGIEISWGKWLVKKKSL